MGIGREEGRGAKLGEVGGRGGGGEGGRASHADQEPLNHLVQHSKQHHRKFP